MTYPSMPWVVILVVSMIYRVFVFQTKINKYLEGQTCAVPPPGASRTPPPGAGGTAERAPLVEAEREDPERRAERDVEEAEQLLRLCVCSAHESACWQAFLFAHRWTIDVCP